jgi:hypothetical protein
MIDHELGVETADHQKMRGTGYNPHRFRTCRAVGEDRWLYQSEDPGIYNEEDSKIDLYYLARKHVRFNGRR